VRVPKFSKLGLPRLWGPITLCAELRLKCGLKQNCSSRQNLFNSMWHATYAQGNQGDSRLLVVDHNLCFKCPNESCEPILDIYILRTFQWYKELFNPMGFDFCNHSLKIQESIKAPTSKVGVHLRMWGFIPSHSLRLSRAWDVTLGLPLLAHTLISPCLGRKPKVKVTT
jgi:hypothetical protein